MSLCLYAIINQTWRIKAVILKQIQCICSFEIYKEISFSHSNWDGVNGHQRVSTVLSGYSGEFECCKDICRSEKRLIDRDVCEDRKNLHSACQQVELSVLHLTTSICRTNTTGLRSRERKKKASRVTLGQQHCLERTVFCGFLPRKPHIYTYGTQSPAWPVAPAHVAAVCSTGLYSGICSGFSSAILQAHGLSVGAWLCTSDKNSLFYGISYFKWLFLPFFSFSIIIHFGYSVCYGSNLLLIALIQNLLIIQIVHVSFKASKYMFRFIDVERAGKGLIFFFCNRRAMTDLKLFHGLRYQENNTQRNKIYVWLIFSRTFHSDYCGMIYLFSVFSCSQSLNIF